MSLLRYTALRLVVLVVVGALLYASGARGLLLVALAFVLSGLVSLVLLRRARGKVSEDLVDRVERRGPRTGLMGRVSARIEAANQAEDDAVDRATSDHGATDEVDMTAATDDDRGDEPHPPSAR